MIGEMYSVKADDGEHYLVGDVLGTVGALDHLIAPVLEPLVVLGRRTEHLADQRHREVARHVGDEVALAPLVHVVDELRRHGTHV